MMRKSNFLEEVVEGLKTWARVGSPWVLHFNSGSCNGCDIEILATLTPRYDLERLGVKLQASPRRRGYSALHRPRDAPGARSAIAYLRPDARAEVCSCDRLLCTLRGHL